MYFLLFEHILFGFPNAFAPLKYENKQPSQFSVVWRGCFGKWVCGRAILHINKLVTDSVVQASIPFQWNTT